MTDVLDAFQRKARDHARTPMQVRRLRLTDRDTSVHRPFHLFYPSVGCHAARRLHDRDAMDAR